MIGSTAGEVVVRTRMYGESSAFHIAIVPPLAALDSSGRLGQNESSPFKLKENVPENIENIGDKSQLNIWGSLRKISTGSYVLTK